MGIVGFSRIHTTDSHRFFGSQTSRSFMPLAKDASHPARRELQRLHGNPKGDGMGGALEQQVGFTFSSWI